MGRKGSSKIEIEDKLESLAKLMRMKSIALEQGLKLY